MKSRGILWSPRMVRAILNTVAGSDPAVALDPSEPLKAETRRIIKVPVPGGKRGARQPVPAAYRLELARKGLPVRVKAGEAIRTLLIRDTKRCPVDQDPPDSPFISFREVREVGDLAFDIVDVVPPVEVGDELWGRETFAVGKRWNDTKPRDLPEFPVTWYPSQVVVGVDAGALEWPVDPEGEPRGRGRPGRFMPRCLSRILHEVTSLRAERLQSTPAEAFALEGFVPSPGSDRDREDFAAGWDTINGKRAGCAWEDNPWVWVIGIKRLMWWCSLLKTQGVELPERLVCPTPTAGEADQVGSR